VTKKTPPKGGGTHADRIKRERGAGKSASPDPGPSSVAREKEAFGEDFLTPVEMREWAQGEIRAAARAFDMRARQLLDLVADYSAGKITPEKADEMQSRYYHRWGDALPTPLGDPPRTDEELLAGIDKVRSSFIAPRTAFEQSRTIRVESQDGKSR
jgi:hypothetical protein